MVVALGFSIESKVWVSKRVWGRKIYFFPIWGGKTLFSERKIPMKGCAEL